MQSHYLIFCILISLSTQSIYNKGWEQYFEDVSTEVHDVPLTWEVGGQLPSWLRGSFIKNGPSQKRFGSEDRYYANYADSWAKLNKVTFTGDGSALFSGRMIETNNYNRCVEADKIMPSVTAGPLKPNDWNALEIIEGFAHLYDNTNVILWRLGPEDPEQATYIATTDYPLVNKIDPDTLAVTGSHRPPVTDGISMSSCSHWTREIGTDNSLNFHMMYNPWTMKPDFVLYRYQDKVEEKVEIEVWS